MPRDVLGDEGGDGGGGDSIDLSSLEQLLEWRGGFKLGPDDLFDLDDQVGGGFHLTAPGDFNITGGGIGFAPDGGPVDFTLKRDSANYGIFTAHELDLVTGASGDGLYVREDDNWDNYVGLSKAGTVWVEPKAINTAFVALHTATSGVALRSGVKGEATTRFRLLTDGTMEWGGGTLAEDVSLGRELDIGNSNPILAARTLGFELIDDVQNLTTQSDMYGQSVWTHKRDWTLGIGMGFHDTPRPYLLTYDDEGGSNLYSDKLEFAAPGLDPVLSLSRHDTYVSTFNVDGNLYAYGPGTPGGLGQVYALKDDESTYSGLNPNGFIEALSATYVFGAKHPASANYEFVVSAAGQLEWGPGSAGTDTFLSRGEAGQLETAGRVFAHNGLETGGAAQLKVYAVDADTLGVVAGVGSSGLKGLTLGGSVDTGYSLGASSHMKMGLEGPSAQAGLSFGGDTNLYRRAANVLKTDDALELANNGATYLSVGGTGTVVPFGGIEALTDIISNVSATEQVKLGKVSGQAAIVFGSAGDTNLYRESTGNCLKTDDEFIVGANLYVGYHATVDLDLTVTASGGGVRLHSPNGTLYTVTVSDAGALVVT